MQLKQLLHILDTIPLPVSHSNCVQKYSYKKFMLFSLTLFFIFLFIPVTFGAIQFTDIKAAWDFNDNSIDVHNNNNYSSFGNPIYHSIGGVKNSGYYSFDGVTINKISYNNNHATFYDLGISNFAISAWINFFNETNITGTMYIASDVESQPNCCGGWRLGVAPKNSTHITLTFDSSKLSGSGGSAFAHIPKTELFDNGWHHILGQRGRHQLNIGNVHDLYFDGTLYVGSQPSGTDMDYQNNWGVTIGGLSEEGNKAFTGSIDEVTLFNRYLTTSEINDMFNENQTYPFIDLPSLPQIFNTSKSIYNIDELISFNFEPAYGEINTIRLHKDDGINTTLSSSLSDLTNSFADEYDLTGLPYSGDGIRGLASSENYVYVHEYNADTIYAFYKNNKTQAFLFSYSGMSQYPYAVGYVEKTDSFVFMGSGRTVIETDEVGSLKHTFTMPTQCGSEQINGLSANYLYCYSSIDGKLHRFNVSAFPTLQSLKSWNIPGELRTYADKRLGDSDYEEDQNDDPIVFKRYQGNISIWRYNATIGTFYMVDYIDGLTAGNEPGLDYDPYDQKLRYGYGYPDSQGHVYYINFTYNPYLSIAEKIGIGTYRFSATTSNIAGENEKLYTNYFQIIAKPKPTWDAYSPATNTNHNTNVTFFYYVEDQDDNLANCTLLKNGIPTSTETTITNNAENNITYVVNGDSNNYQFQITCYDLDGNYGSTSIKTIRIDTIDPQIIINNPLLDNTTKVDSKLQLNISMINDALNLTYMNITNATNTVYYNQTTQILPVVNYSDIVDTTLWNEGIYEVEFYASDDINEKQSTISFEICHATWMCNLYSTCTITDESFCIGVEDTHCSYDQSEYKGNYTEFTPLTCNYCTSTWTTTLTPCISKTQNITYQYSNTCCEQTGLPGDCNIPLNKTNTTCSPFTYESSDLAPMIIDGTGSILNTLKEFAFPIVLVLILSMLPLSLIGLKLFKKSKK